MCGITGWASFDSHFTDSQAVIDAMTTAMRRGPDGHGTWVRRHVALGHQRLVIRKSTDTYQPVNIETPAGSIALAYDGELYNGDELRKALIARGHRFETESDSELLLNAYLQWGELVSEYLNGMFAIAIWDGRCEELLLIRDRMGVKPLYYYPLPSGALFASEPKSILVNPLATKTVDADGLRDLITMIETPGYTLWSGMYEVKAATTVRVNSAGIRSRAYWNLSAKPHTDSLKTTVETVGDLMIDVVRRQLAGELLPTVLLSGGLDSSALTGLAAAELAEQREQLRTVSIGFSDVIDAESEGGTSDTPYVHDVVNHVGSSHRHVVLGVADLTDLTVRRAVITARDAPRGVGDVDFSRYLLCGAIREQSVTAASGQVADAVFGEAKYAQPHGTGREIETFPWLGPSWSAVNPRASLLRPELRDKLDLDSFVANHYATAVAGIEHLDDTSGVERRMRTISNLYLTRAARYLLDHEDRLSAAAGIQMRVPFCDHRLVEYLYNIPWSLKTFDGREKSLLRDATRRVLPSSVVQRQKSAYPSTPAPGYDSALQQQLKEVITDHNSGIFALVDRKLVAEALRANSIGTIRTLRCSMEWVLDLYHWFDIYKPKLLID